MLHCVSVFQLSFGTFVILLCELMPLEMCHLPQMVSTTCCNLFSYICWALIPPMDVTHPLAPALGYASGLLPPHGDQPDQLMIIKFEEIKECNWEHSLCFSLAMVPLPSGLQFPHTLFHSDVLSREDLTVLKLISQVFQFHFHPRTFPDWVLRMSQ